MSRYAMLFLFFFSAAPLCAQSDLAFPQLAVGGNPAYETVLQVINEVETDNPIIIEVFQGGLSGSANGTALAVQFDGGIAATSRSLILKPYQEFTTVITRSDATLKNGWLRAHSTINGGKISANLLFRQRSGGTLLDSVGVTSQRFREAVVLVDQRESGSDTGLAFANPDGAALTVTMDLFQGSNRLASPLPITLQPHQQFAKLVSEMFPSFGAQQGTLIISSAPGRTVPCLALRLDGLHLTSIPVRPLGFSFQYTILDNSGSVIETGSWMFDLVGFNLVGTGKAELPIPGEFYEVTGSWVGTNFQFRYRQTQSDGRIGMVVFNGTSAGLESTVGSDGNGHPITGKVTAINSDGQVNSVNNFSAYHKFALP
jgi:hypothetical protein